MKQNVPYAKPVRQERTGKKVVVVDGCVGGVGVVVVQVFESWLFLFDIFS